MPLRCCRVSNLERCRMLKPPQVGLSIIIRFLFGGELATSVFIAGIVTMIYTGAGGLLSVAYTGETRDHVEECPCYCVVRAHRCVPAAPALDLPHSPVPPSIDLPYPTSQTSPRPRSDFWACCLPRPGCSTTGSPPTPPPASASRDTSTRTTPPARCTRCVYDAPAWLLSE